MKQTLSDVWELLTEEEQQLLQNFIKIRRYQKNEVIYHEGDEPNCLFCVVKGKVKIYKEGVGGRHQIMRMVKPKEFFGYRASFVGQHYITEAGAFEETTLLHIPLPVAKKIITQNNAVSIYFLKELAYYLGTAGETTVSLTQKHVRGRLAEALLRLKDNFGTTENGQTLYFLHDADKNIVPGHRSARSQGGKGQAHENKRGENAHQKNADFLHVCFSFRFDFARR